MISSLVLAAALALPGADGMSRPCPWETETLEAAHSVPSACARAPDAAAAQRVVADGYRLTDDPQYRLAAHVRDRLADASRHRLVRRDEPGAPVDDRRRVIPPGMKNMPVAMVARASRFSAAIRTAARAEGVEPALLHAVIAAESGYDPGARSHKGAMGLMQLMPGTAAQYGVVNPQDPAQNLHAGARHLRYLLGRFDNDVELALAAYNAGEQAVDRHGNRIPPYPETRAYVQRVLAHYGRHVRSPPLPGPP